MPRCAVLGSPISHSLSPILHRAAYAELGLADWTYDAIDVTESQLADFLASCGPEWAGLSLTMPLKREVLALAEQVSALAMRAQAANTLLRTESGWHADNTDVPGAVNAIKERWSEPIHSAVIVGAGATAGSLVLALEMLGCESVRVLSRSEDRAAAALSVSPIATWAPLAGPALEADLIASTIPATAQSQELIQRTQGTKVLFDVIYHPWPTPLVQHTSGTVVSGLDLLVHQAVLQVSAMTGVGAAHLPLAAMRAAGEAAVDKPPSPKAPLT